jgi:integrase
MASIQKRGTDSWRLTIELGYDNFGKRIQKKKTIQIEDSEKMKKGELKKMLDSELAKFKIEVEVGEYISPDKMRFDQFTNEWKLKFVEKQLEQTSQENYISIATNRLIPYFGHMRMDQIQTFHIMNFMESLDRPEARLDGKTKPLSSSSKIYIYRVLRSILMRAMDWKVIKVNPMVGVAKPKEVNKVEHEVYDEHEVMQVFEALQTERPDFRMMVTLALTTGLRRGELLGLEWKSMDLDNGTVEVRQAIPRFKNGAPLIKLPKNKSSIRKVSLPKSVIEDLKEFQSLKKRDRWNVHDLWEAGERSFVFCHINGQAYSHNWPTKQWQRFYSKLTGIKYIRFHDLRHTSATLLINQGVHAKIISERLGHSDIGITMNVYGHALRAADHAAASKLDFLFEGKEQKNKKA